MVSDYGIPMLGRRVDTWSSATWMMHLQWHEVQEVKHISYFVVGIKQLNEMVREMDIKTKVQLVTQARVVIDYGGPKDHTKVLCWAQKS